MFKTLSAPLALAAILVSSLAQALPLADHLPLAFEPNRGQAEAGTDYVARAPGFGLLLNAASATLQLPGATAGSATRLRMTLTGANARAQAEPLDRLPGISNYFLGSAADQWQTAVPNFARVRYHGVYPGIDLMYYGREGSLEYDFVLAPNADPARIDLAFEGAESLTVDPEGNLRVRTAQGELVQHRPLVWQQREGARMRVEGRYVLKGQHAAIVLGRYEHGLPVVIDPVLAWSGYLGGSRFDTSNAVAVGREGASYLTGMSYSADLAGAQGGQGSGDAYVVKLSRDGKQVLYTTWIGGSGLEVAQGLALGSDSSIWLAGYTRSRNFPATREALQRHLGAGAVQNAFVAHLDEAGGLAYASYLGGSASDAAQGVALAEDGSVYLTGQATSPDFPITRGAFQRALNGLQNAFVAHLSRDGRTLEYATLLGGDGYDVGSAIAVDRLGQAFVTGTTYAVFSSTFPTTKGAYQVNGGMGTTDAFVAKLAADGAQLLYSTLLGGSDHDGGRAIANDAQGRAVVVGYTASANFPVSAGALQVASGGGTDAFVARLSADGSALEYSTLFGGTGNDAADALALAANGDACITGYTQSADFHTTLDALQSSYTGNRMPFVAVIAHEGTQLAYSTLLGGSNADAGTGIALDPMGGLTVVGNSTSLDFPVSDSAFQRTLKAGAIQNAFVARITGVAAAVR